ncbi:MULTISPECIES: ABC transporter substrate-binding protein [Thalassotalea]|uniref:ABC transporter substrate-binding protein n=1 Tax=Thalassotalea TaxID=1518149 RepID=UPI0009448887|nr:MULTISPECIES: ABC transporter substrate-binding protein [Thalassotalea]OKY24837.1 hypothetical protein BI291_04565 [Thalassotalea sp. PP2-459]
MLSTLTYAQFNEDNLIKLAVSNVTKGPAAQIGIRLNQGAEVYFQKVNHQNELPGYRIEMTHRNDSYEPFNTLKNTQYFLQQGDFFAFFNYVGTPTTAAILETIKNNKLPFLTPFTGAYFLRKPAIKNIFTLRASYYQEVKAQLDYLINTRGFKNIGLLIQADDFGYAVEKGYKKIMESYHVTPTITARYRRNTEDIQTALMLLRKHKVEAVAFVGTYKPLSTLINQAYEQDFTPFFSSVSFISSADLFPLLKYHSDVLITEVFPDPKDCKKAYCRQFVEDMNAAGYSDLDRIQLEGYMNGYLFTQVAKQCINTMTPTCFLNEIQNFSSQQLDIKIEFSPLEHQGLNNVYLNIYSPVRQ